ncbi:MAG TPA: NAD(P)-binding domain-containing protein [Polyangiaceae bacterium]|nr:NAD(P)-binding domain-containing protein [Polyangiaceae bacterium]HYQ26437.1 NAD(P)-binding domain-containing protein [Polyangiaceae bacterium]
MKIGVLGTGMVGQTIGAKLIALGHEVKLGSRTPSNEKARAWADELGARASHGTFAECAAFGELLFNCTTGEASLEVLAAAGDANLADKVLIDVSNPLDFSKGRPPTLFVCNDDSLAERIQRAHPRLKVVKTLNTVNCEVMVDPARVAGGDHTMFLCGNDQSAKASVRELLTDSFGWRDVIDLGDISNARATEALLPIWVRLWSVLKTGDFNVKVAR